MLSQARLWEVATLVSEGLSNSEIAERLRIDRGTVANQVSSILDRLGFQGRAQIAVWVVTHAHAE